MRNTVRKAFTLVEILIVVVILGILAAIVVPQFTSASEDAQIGNIETQLQTIRQQIELYRVRNNGDYPSLAWATANGWGDMSTERKADGTTPDGMIGPDYLRSEPINPRTGKSTIIIGANPDAPVVSGDDGWWYDTTGGSGNNVFGCNGFVEANTVGETDQSAHWKTADAAP